MTASLVSALQALNEQPWSVAVRESVWMYPIIESVHVLTISLFVGYAVFLDLRLLGIYLEARPVSEVAAAFLPRTRVAFILMVLTGALLFLANPVAFSHNVFVQAKLVTIVLAAINILVYHQIVAADIQRWDKASLPPLRARISGGLSILFWMSVLACGRLIAYNWFK